MQPVWGMEKATSIPINSRSFYPPTVPADPVIGNHFLSTFPEGYEAEVALRLAAWRRAQQEALGCK